MAPTNGIQRLGGALFAIIMAGCLSGQALADPPQPTPVTPQLIAAAKAEGLVVFYSSYETVVGEKFRKAFKEKYGIDVQVERNGSERVFQRLTQEYDSGVHQVDFVDTSDPTHFLFWKRKGWLAPFVPVEIAKWPTDQKDPDGFYASDRFSLSVLGYNTKQVKAEDAPKSYADMLDPKWKGKIVKAHPAYSGNTMASTFALSRLLGWSYFEKLAKQSVLQVQSSNDPTQKLQLGERAVMFDGNEYNALNLKAAGAPLEIVYAAEGTPMIPGVGAVLKDAPHPNAARLFAAFLYSREIQQLQCDVAHLRSFHPDVIDPAGVTPSSKIKLMKIDPEALEGAIREIREKYAEYFGT